MLPFPQKISLEQKYTHHVVDVHDVRSLQQFLIDFEILLCHYAFMQVLS